MAEAGAHQQGVSGHTQPQPAEPQSEHMRKLQHDKAQRKVNPLCRALTLDTHVPFPAQASPPLGGVVLPQCAHPPVLCRHSVHIHRRCSSTCEVISVHQVHMQGCWAAEVGQWGGTGGPAG